MPEGKKPSLADVVFPNQSESKGLAHAVKKIGDLGDTKTPTSLPEAYHQRLDFIASNVDVEGGRLPPGTQVDKYGNPLGSGLNGFHSKTPAFLAGFNAGEVNALSKLRQMPMGSLSPLLLDIDNEKDEAERRHRSDLRLREEEVRIAELEKSADEHKRKYEEAVAAREAAEASTEERVAAVRAAVEAQVPQKVAESIELLKAQEETVREKMRIESNERIARERNTADISIARMNIEAAGVIEDIKAKHSAELHALKATHETSLADKDREKQEAVANLNGKTSVRVALITGVLGAIVGAVATYVLKGR